MTLFVLLCFVAAAGSFCAAQDAVCEGPSGNTVFDDSGFTQYGDITGFEVWHGTTTCVMDGIRLKYGEVWGNAHNGGGGSKDRIEFVAGEVITGIDMDKRDHWGFEVLCQITIYTSVRAYGPYCNHDCNNDRCGTTVSGSFSHVSGRHGINLDALTWHGK